MNTIDSAGSMDGTPEPRDSGLGLVELIVAIGLFGVLTTILLGFAISTSQVTDDTRELANVREESQLAMERMTRELRQAQEVRSVDNDLKGFTFWTDFDGNTFAGYDASDPEVLAYRWDSATKQLTLTAKDADGDPIGDPLPVLAAKVSTFNIEFRSSSWEYDSNGNGTTTWEELDQALAPVGNNNGTPDAAELKYIDLVGVTMTVTDGAHKITYETQVDLRNQNQDS